MKSLDSLVGKVNFLLESLGITKEAWKPKDISSCKELCSKIVSYLKKGAVGHYQDIIRLWKLLLFTNPGVFSRELLISLTSQPEQYQGSEGLKGKLPILLLSEMKLSVFEDSLVTK